MWNKILTGRDVTELMKKFGQFHDSCIREFRYISGAFVDKDLAMHADDDVRVVTIVFQRQALELMSIEVEFSELVRLNLEPCEARYSCEIFEATMFIEKDLVYWGSSGDFATKREHYRGTWLCAGKARWRALEFTDFED